MSYILRVVVEQNFQPGEPVVIKPLFKSEIERLKENDPDSWGKYIDKWYPQSGYRIPSYQGGYYRPLRRYGNQVSGTEIKMNNSSIFQDPYGFQTIPNTFHLSEKKAEELTSFVLLDAGFVSLSYPPSVLTKPRLSTNGNRIDLISVVNFQHKINLVDTEAKKVAFQNLHLEMQMKSISALLGNYKAPYKDNDFPEKFILCYIEEF